jgi:hypothetical protein
MARLKTDGTKTHDQDQRTRRHAEGHQAAGLSAQFGNREIEKRRGRPGAAIRLRKQGAGSYSRRSAPNLKKGTIIMAGIKTDLTALALTANAQSVGQSKGVNLQSLINQALQETTDLTRLLNAIVAIHPNGGGDSANFTTLNNAITNYLS